MYDHINNIKNKVQALKNERIIWIINTRQAKYKAIEWGYSINIEIVKQNNRTWVQHEVCIHARQ